MAMTASRFLGIEQAFKRNPTLEAAEKLLAARQEYIENRGPGTPFDAEDDRTFQAWFEAALEEL